MDGKTIGIGVIGAGFGSYVLVPAFKTLPDVTVVGIASRDSAHAEHAAREYALRAYSSYDELLQDPMIAAVAVALPPREHFGVVLESIRLGKHVFCEKPLALTVRSAHEMMQEAQKANIVHMVDFEFRELPEMRAFREIVHSGALGAIQSISSVWSVGTWSNPSRPWSWKCDLEQGGGVLTALGIHMLDLLEWIVGSIHSVQAVLSTHIVHRPLPSGEIRSVTAEDTAEIDLLFRSGLVGSLKVSNVETSGVGQWLTLHGDRKSVRVGSANAQHYGQSFDLDEKIDGVWQPIPLKREAIHTDDGRVRAVRVLALRFIDAIRTGNRDVRPSFIDGVRGQILLDAVRESYRLRTSVEIVEPLA